MSLSVEAHYIKRQKTLQTTHGYLPTAEFSWLVVLVSH